jgi:hypothetical protein
VTFGKSDLIREGLLYNTGIIPMDPALFSAYIDIMLGFPANKKNIIKT